MHASSAWWKNVNKMYTRDQALEDQKGSEARIKAYMETYERWEDRQQTFRGQASGQQFMMMAQLPATPSRRFVPQKSYLKEDIKLHAWHLRDYRQDDLIAVLIERALGNTVKLEVF